MIKQLNEFLLGSILNFLDDVNITKFLCTCQYFYNKNLWQLVLEKRIKKSGESNLNYGKLFNKKDPKNILIIFNGILDFKRKCFPLSHKLVIELYNDSELLLMYHGLNNKLSKNIHYLINLKYINLPCNNITKITKSIGNLGNLKTLNLWNNNLTELPDSLGNLHQLYHLDLSNNKILRLPKTIKNLINLKHLNVCNNLLIQIPEGIDNLILLQYLNISNNRLSKNYLKNFEEKIKLKLSNLETFKSGN